MGRRLPVDGESLTLVNVVEVRNDLDRAETPWFASIEEIENSESGGRRPSSVPGAPD